MSAPPVPKVLVADDSPVVLRMIEKVLDGAGFEVITARDGLEAIEKAFSEDVGLVILDVMMPRMNGYQACRLLKNEPVTKSVPVIILTSRDQAADRFWGLETGADYYVTKDSEPQRILDLVKTLLSGESVPRPPRAAEGQRASIDILSRVNELLDRKLFEMTMLSEIGRVARCLVHFDETFTSVMALVARVVDFTIGAMAFIEDESLDVVLMLNRPASPSVIEEAKERLLEAIAKQRQGAIFARVHARLFYPAEPPAGQPEETILGGFATFPVFTSNRLIGVMGVGGKAVSRIDGDTESLLEQVTNQAQIVMENSRLFERVRNLSIQDSLTELFNHRHSIEVLSREFDRVGRYQDAVSVLMIDIDHFKKVNDDHGHPTGDGILREVARVLRGLLRTVDTVGRYGGEEFVAILPHTGYEDARVTAERIRATIEGHTFRIGSRELQATVSIGVATYPSTAVASANELIRQADQALYRAKEAGRNGIA